MGSARSPKKSLRRLPRCLVFVAVLFNVVLLFTLHRRARGVQPASASNGAPYITNVPMIDEVAGDGSSLLAKEPPSGLLSKAPLKAPPETGDPFWTQHRKAVSYTKFDGELRSISDKRHAPAVAAMRGSTMRCSLPERPMFGGVKVLVTGLSRSGSTWQYNAIKKILERAIAVARAEGRLEEPGAKWAVRSEHADADSEQFDSCLATRVCVLKTHMFVPRLLLKVDVVLSSHRDVRDVVLSSMLMFRACFAPTGETRTQRSHGVAVRFQQYAHWTPYVCYDMTYETMMENRTAEVGRLAAATLRGNRRLVTAIDAQGVVDDVAALSKRKPEKCVHSMKAKGKGAPKECWDKGSGFAASHVHESTSKPMAWARLSVLDEVQRRVPTCDVFASLRRVLEGFGGWLVAHGYRIDVPIDIVKEEGMIQANFSQGAAEEEPTEPLVGSETDAEEDPDTPSWLKTAPKVAKLMTRSEAIEKPATDDGILGRANNDGGASARNRRNLLSVGFYPFDDDDEGVRGDEGASESSNTKPGNTFIESLPEAEYAMDADMRLPRGGFPALYPRFVHVVNPFARSGPHPTTTIGGKAIDEDEVAHASIGRAWKLARWYGVDVEIAAALRVDDRDADRLSSRWPVRRACLSENGINTQNGMRLPLLKDLLACADANDSGAQFVILTNPDILLHHHFYLRLYQLTLDERLPLRTAWSITRRQISPRNFKDVADILSTPGEPHLGHDTFVFPREWLKRIDVANLVPGFSPWGGAFLGMLSHLGRAVVLGDKRWTFHLAADGVASGKNRSAALFQQLWTKRAEVCENAPGTLYNTRAAASALASTLDESTPSRCCCPLDEHSAPHATTRMPGPNSYHALSMLSGLKRPPVKPIGLQSYEYLWDRLGPDLTLSRCGALPGIQLLPIEDLKSVVQNWCRKQQQQKGFACPGSPTNVKRPRNTDCARRDAREGDTFEKELTDDIQRRGSPMTALVVYEKLPTPYEGGHVRVRQLLSWLCYQGHRVLLVHRDSKTPLQSSKNNATSYRHNDKEFLPLAVDVGVPGCGTENLAVFAVDEKMSAMTAHELARQRVDVAFVTVWFYRVEADPIPAIVLPVLKKLSRLRQRKVKIALVSDDVQYERALAVGKSRGDPPDYWRKVHDDEIEFYSHPTVEVVFAISDDDKETFADLQRQRRHEGGRRLADNSTRKTPPPPPIGVLPYVARIDGTTTKRGWSTHTRSGPQRHDFVFVGGGTFSNRAAVRWLLRAALPAVVALPDSEGGCAELRRARMVFAGTMAWAEEAKKACTEARSQKKQTLVDLLCGQADGKNMKKFGKWEASGVRALGRVDDIGTVLRKAKMFVAPAVVASGISTKVWLAVEHGLPVATSFDGTRGLPKESRREAARNLPPWTLIGSAPMRNASAPTAREILSRDSAVKFAKDAARVYCDKEVWRKHAHASLLLAKRLESREPWSGDKSKLAELFSSTPKLRCVDNLDDKRALDDDIDLQTSLIDDIQAKFKSMHRQHDGCRGLAREGI